MLIYPFCVPKGLAKSVKIASFSLEILEAVLRFSALCLAETRHHGKINRIKADKDSDTLKARLSDEKSSQIRLRSKTPILHKVRNSLLLSELPYLAYKVSI